MIRMRSGAYNADDPAPRQYPFVRNVSVGRVPVSGNFSSLAKQAGKYRCATGKTAGPLCAAPGTTSRHRDPVTFEIVP